MHHRHADRARDSRGGLDRRSVLFLGAGGLASISLASLLPAAYAAAPARPAAPRSRARSVILIWLSGGPSHTDTFDPKPGIGVNYTGKFDRDLATNVPGIRLALPLPRLAKQADKFALIRGMTHADDGHETASYKNLTGTTGTGNLSYPLVGAVVAQKRYEEGYQRALPPFVVLGTPFTRVGGAGFLGRRCEPFVSSAVAGPSADVLKKSQERRELLTAIDTLGADAVADPAFKQIRTSREAAFGLVLGEERKAFDVADEPKTVHELYGANPLSQRCLLARRLVERGVPFVAISHDGWDTHARHFDRMEQDLGPALDQALSSLLVDLQQRGLLDSTVVVCVGEFGRTPVVHTEAPWFGGRHHHGQAFSALVAGGGFRGGQLVGETDRVGAKVIKRPVYPWDLWGSVYQLLGIDPNSSLPHPEGRAVRVTPVGGPNVASGGLLTEIM